MKERDIEHELQLLHRQVEEAFTREEDTRIELIAAIDALRLDIETLRRFLGRYHPDFVQKYAEARHEVALEIDPEGPSSAVE